ncbi:flagellar protein FlaG [Piscirickettsia litoralis]|nr:flagellar protein FlaG [Piscirickettsia litoralis]
MKLEHTSIQTHNADAQTKVSINEAERLTRLDQELKEQTVVQDVDKAEPSSDIQSKERLEQAIVDINQFIKPIHGQKISFELREDVDETVAFVQDKQTGEVIRQIPSEEVLKIHSQIKALQEQGDESALSLLSNFRV